MKKMTMQEFADFFGVYVAKDEAGGVYAYETIPFLGKTSHKWYAPGKSFAQITFLVSDATTHDYRILVEPHTKEEL